MTSNSFLDTGVILGFCFMTDLHHHKCKKYIKEKDSTIFYSGRVENEYKKKRKHLSVRYADAVRDHASTLQKSDYEGELNPTDIRGIRESILDDCNAASHFLEVYYRQKVQKYIKTSDLIEQLREISRGIERHALKKKTELDSAAQVWMRFDSYPELQHKLVEIHGEDRDICIDAHDLALEIKDKVELATTNPTDFVYNGHKRLIKSETEIQEVTSLAVTSS